ncbi:Bax inhibitor-1/YccA family protein [Brachyspira hyodysenteriae]|nr:Bax inhibitor-1/YccA family protein [Brachyspira hyodysenteriae]MDA1470332.1 Bax inhibitor-1/YccA family protein [Brachyspira hyodysenteriae]
MANPVLSDKAFNYASSYENENTMTLNGAINKSIILTLVLMLSAMVSVFFVLAKRPEMIYPAAFGSSIAAFVLALIMTFKKELSKVFLYFMLY